MFRALSLSIALFICGVILTSSNIKYQAGSGITSPEAVGTFLNGNFPNQGPPENIETYEAFPNISFDSPITFTMHPREERIFLGQRDGKIYHFPNDPNVSNKTMFLDISSKVGVVWDGGFLGFAFHPNFGLPGSQGSNYFYVYYCTKDGGGGNNPTSPVPMPCRDGSYWNGGYNILARYEVFPGTLNVRSGSEEIMIRTRHYNSTHYGGDIKFGLDGFLYVPTGEQAQHTTAQNLSDNLDGGVLRLDVDRDPSKSHAPRRTLPKDSRGPDEISGREYWIPNDNPFQDTNGGRFEEYYTIGHRNPHRMTMDALTGKFYIGEIGSNIHEEINVVESGKNYGWPVYEGFQKVDFCLGGLYNNMPMEEPLTAFPRGAANAIMGGFVYRGSAIPCLYGKYICADYGNGEELFTVDINNGYYEQIGAFFPGDVISFGEDHDNEIYILGLGNNRKIHKMRLSGDLPQAPSTLSQTGAFSNLSTMQPNSGVIPYDMIEPFWSDGALKKRWMVVPNDGSHNTSSEKIKFSENGEWEMPTGAVLIKHFELPLDKSNPTITRKLETRFSIKGTDGRFYFLTYKWRDDQTDADLISTSLEEDYTITETDGSQSSQTWHYPNQGECLTCHNSASKGTLGLRTRHLNRNYEYAKSGIEANQLVSLSYIGLLDRYISDDDVPNYLTAVAKDDNTATLEERARTYLDINCGYCHRPGTGNRAIFDARMTTPIDLTNLYSSNINQRVGPSDSRIVYAKEPSLSELFLRLSSTDIGVAMPPIGKHELDDEGIALIEAWINQTNDIKYVCTGSDVVYTLTNINSGKALDVTNYGTANGTNIQQYDLNESTAQQWYFEEAGDNHYVLYNVNSGKVLDVTNISGDNGANVQLYQYNGSGAQLWSIAKVGENEYTLTNIVSEKVLEVAGFSQDNGGNVQQWTYGNANSQKWAINLLSGNCDEILDSDGDGINDDVDQCPGLDDNIIGTPCDDEDPCTVGETYDSNCNCGGGDLIDNDNDGVCDDVDQCPGLNDNIIGTSCDDGNPCTVGEVYNSNCDCTGGSLLDDDNDGVCNVFDQCPGFDDSLDEDRDGIPDGCDICDEDLIGTQCDDGDPCTSGEVYDTDCNCAGGIYQDDDGDGVCNVLDQCAGFNDNLDEDEDGIPDGCDNCSSNLIGTACDDGDPCTAGEIYDNNCDCIGGVLLDDDGDGVCNLSDQCSGFDDNLDQDLDGIPDGCDDCDGGLVGSTCDDGDPCTVGEAYDNNCNCTGGQLQDQDNDGICAADDINDNDPCVPVPIPSLCSTLNCDDVYDSNSFEMGLGIWNDGGADAYRLLNAQYARTGDHSFRIRDNSGASSSLYTDAMNWSTVNGAEVKFSFYPNSMENGESFLLELSLNGGASYELVKEWTSGTDFNNNQFYDQIVALDYTSFNQNVVLRFRCDASSNGDQIYLDDIVIVACSDDDNSTCTVGGACDDYDPCTVGETYDGDCNCIGGTLLDDDNDGVCNLIDQCAGFDDGLDSDGDGIPDGCDSCNGLLIGTACDDNDPCTMGETYDAQCNCSQGQFIDEDNDGICAANDLDDYDPCIPVSALSSCYSDDCMEMYDANSFETALGIWNDGGSDAYRLFNTQYAKTGSYSLRIRDNSGQGSSFYTNALNWNNVSSAEVKFSFYPNSMENGESFSLELSLDGGTSYQSVKMWTAGTNFSNYQTYDELVVIDNINFNQNVRLRFICDASSNGDQIYLDDIEILTCVDGDGPSCIVGGPCDDGNDCTTGETYDAQCLCGNGIYVDQDGDGFCIADDPNDNDPCVPVSGSVCGTDSGCSELYSDDFESNLGIWNDGGSDAYRVNNSTFANSGNYSLRIRDNSGPSSSFYTTPMDLSGYSSAQVSFSYYPNSMESGEVFYLEISTNGGATYSIVGDWVSGDDFVNTNRYSESVFISGIPFTDNVVLRFRCDASSNADQVYLDDVVIESCSTSNLDSSVSLTKNKISEMSIAPNPVSNRLAVLGLADVKGIRYEIYSMTGMKIESDILKNHVIDVSPLESGVYVIRVYTEESVHNTTFIKTNN